MESIAGMSAADTQILRKIQTDTLSTLAEVFEHIPETVAVLDYPRYKNAGDALIWKGEMNYLARLGTRVGYVADIGRTNFSELRRRVPEGPILLQGGGNFGDVWPVFQESREHVVVNNHDRKIICLPQTVKFLSKERAKRTNDIFASHGRVTVLVREHGSLEHARKLMPDVDFRFCYDAALGNEPFLRVDETSFETVVLARKDLESAGGLPNLALEDSTFVDWNLRPLDQAKWVANRIPLAVYKRLPARGQAIIQPLVDSRYLKFTELNLNNAARTLSQGKTVVTDRLHAHVLALLLGIPHIVLENSYGKIRPIFDEYSGLFSTANFTKDVGDVPSLLKRIAVER